MIARSMAEVCSTRKKRRIGLRMLSELKITLGLIRNNMIPTSNCKCAKYIVNLENNLPVLPIPFLPDNPDIARMIEASSPVSKSHLTIECKCLITV
jgi:hypothetical protein